MAVLGAVPAQAAHAPLIQLISEMPSRLILGFPGTADEWTLIALAASFVLCADTARPPESAKAARPGLRDFVPEIWFVGAVIGYFALPTLWNTGVPLAVRLVAPAAVLGALLPRGPIGGRRAIALLPAALAGIIYPIALAIALHRGTAP
jgi:hypothetical protein